jgi:hypothetical protein
MLTEGDVFLIEQVLNERIESETDVIFAGALSNTLGRLRAIVAEKKNAAASRAAAPGE